MINQSRRTLLKGMGYGIATLATSGAASTVMASSQTVASGTAASQSMQFVMPTCDITIYLQQSVGKEIVSLMNLTDQVVTLDSIKPVALEHINGSLVVKLNNIADGDVVLQPGERLLVLGASGGVGLTAVELGRLMGAEVIAVARGAEKLAICKQAGADHQW